MPSLEWDMNDCMESFYTTEPAMHDTFAGAAAGLESISENPVSRMALSLTGDRSGTWRRFGSYLLLSW